MPRHALCTATLAGNQSDNVEEGRRMNNYCTAGLILSLAVTLGFASTTFCGAQVSRDLKGTHLAKLYWLKPAKGLHRRRQNRRQVHHATFQGNTFDLLIPANTTRLEDSSRTTRYTWALMARLVTARRRLARFTKGC